MDLKKDKHCANKVSMWKVVVSKAMKKRGKLDFYKCLNLGLFKKVRFSGKSPALHLQITVTLVFHLIELPYDIFYKGKDEKSVTKF